jgi:SAM-dependent methyltransferase
MFRNACDAEARQQTSGFQPTAAGTVRDLRERTDLAQDIAFFASRQEARTFAEICLSRTLPALPQSVRYVDYGGGQGLVADAMRSALLAAGRACDVAVVDSNPRYLKDASALNLRTHLANIEDCSLRDADLASMRLVNHYCGYDQQAAIMRGIHDGLRPGGVFVSQIETGSSVICRLQTAISNALSREDCCGYYWPTLDEYVSLARAAGFVEISVIGEKAPVESTINEALAAAWRRFHGHELQALVAEKQAENVQQLLAQRALFFKMCHGLIAEEMDISTQGAPAQPALTKFELCYPVLYCRRSE